MSGGFFDYQQHKIRDIHQSIQSELDSQGKERKTEDYYYSHPENEINFTHSEEIQEQFRNGIEFLKIAEVYAQRIDWYLSGDDGEETFLKRLNEDLLNLKIT